ncbi:MarR family transcriptional regulator [Geomonas sp. Red875]|uniref:MarR family transcriptional regulator n=2 Tax=Geomesophilobacter sediminis TaxID=2798584 RepID=A0A8J7INV5_9BACT|nr:MarR family transcriptional regulator [Geomesophilobacter sediminis]
MTVTVSDIDRHNLLFRLGHLTRRWRRVLDRQINAAGLTDATWRPLLHLHLLGNGVRQKDLAASMGLRGSSLVRLLDNLMEKGLVQRTQSPADRRAKLVRLTPHGEVAVYHIYHQVQQLEADLLSPFDEAETSFLAELVQRLERSVNDVRQRDDQ